jgi:hypothetical protein
MLGCPPPVSVRVNNTSACCLEPVQTGFLESALSLPLNPGKGHVEPRDVMGSKLTQLFFSLLFLSLNQDVCGAGTGCGTLTAWPHSAQVSS